MRDGDFANCFENLEIPSDIKLPLQIISTILGSLLFVANFKVKTFRIYKVCITLLIIKKSFFIPDKEYILTLLSKRVTCVYSLNFNKICAFFFFANFWRKLMINEFDSNSLVMTVFKAPRVKSWDSSTLIRCTSILIWSFSKESILIRE